jgi:hypothetical protein
VDAQPLANSASSATNVEVFILNVPNRFDHAVIAANTA